MCKECGDAAGICKECGDADDDGLGLDPDEFSNGPESPIPATDPQWQVHQESAPPSEYDSEDW